MTKAEIQKHYKMLKIYFAGLGVIILAFVIGFAAISYLPWWYFVICFIIFAVVIAIIIMEYIMFNKLKEAAADKTVKKTTLQQKQIKPTQTKPTAKKTAAENTKPAEAIKKSENTIPVKNYLAQNDAIDALISLGCKKKEAEEAVRNLKLTGAETGEEIVKIVLKGSK